MARMYDNYEFPSRYFGDSSQLTNWILDSGATCHMKPQVSDLFQVCYTIWINILKFRTDITSRKCHRKKKVQVRIKTCDNSRDTFIATLHNVLLAPDLCDGLFSIITLMNLVHTHLFYKGFCMV